MLNCGPHTYPLEAFDDSTMVIDIFIYHPAEVHVLKSWGGSMLLHNATLLFTLSYCACAY